jgi:hypothetical protein
MTQTMLDLIILFEQNGIELILDGGWGVDALLGVQTRSHDDLDVAMPHRYVPLARSLLEARGYTDVPRSDTRDCNFVLGDEHGHLIDFHTYTYDEQGNLILVGIPARSGLADPVSCTQRHRDVIMPGFHPAIPVEYVTYEQDKYYKLGGSTNICLRNPISMYSIGSSQLIVRLLLQ